MAGETDKKVEIKFGIIKATKSQLDEIGIPKHFSGLKVEVVQSLKNYAVIRFKRSYQNKLSRFNNDYSIPLEYLKFNDNSNK